MVQSVEGEGSAVSVSGETGGAGEVWTGDAVGEDAGRSWIIVLKSFFAGMVSRTTVAPSPRSMEGMVTNSMLSSDMLRDCHAKVARAGKDFRFLSVLILFKVSERTLYIVFGSVTVAESFILPIMLLKSICWR